MDIPKLSEKLMAMTDEKWQRHANPWSGWSRMSVLPLILLAVWSRVWLGPWAFVLMGLVLAWTWLNPRLFPAPQSTNNWMSKGVLGERVFLNRGKVPIPQHYVMMGRLLNGGAGLMSLVFVWGLVMLHMPVAILSMLILMLLKLWFVDRMVFLYEEMSAEHAPYAEWLIDS